MKRQSQGFSLVEMMIGMLISLIIILMVLTIYSSSIGKSRKLLQSIQFSEELSALINLIEKDIRRSGYWSATKQAIEQQNLLSTNPFTASIKTLAGKPNNHYYLPFALNINNKADCISFAYDADNNTLDNVMAEDLFAYRLKNGQLQALMDAKINGFLIDPCGSKAGRWMSLTDRKFIKITALNFSRIHSQCFNLSQNLYTSLKTDQSDYACDDLAKKTGDRLLELQQISITIQAQLKQDKQTTRARTRSIALNNHLLYQIP